MFLSFSEVIYVDASSKATLSVDLANVALDKKLGDKWEDTMNWLVCTHDCWLLILDNADDAELDLSPFLPQCMHGNIVITTRNEHLQSYAPGSSCKILRMSNTDAKMLYRRRSLRDANDGRTDELITELIEVRISSL